MLDMQPWLDLISTPECQAELAVSVDAAQQARVLPSIVVVPARETVANQPLSTPAGARHRVALEVLVVTSVRRGNQPLGEVMHDDLKAMREPLLQKLINWLPPGADIEVYWQGGRILNLTSNALVWVDAFKTEYWWSE